MKTYEFRYAFVGTGQTWEEALQDAIQNFPNVGEPIQSELLHEDVKEAQ